MISRKTVMSMYQYAVVHCTCYVDDHYPTVAKSRTKSGVYKAHGEKGGEMDKKMEEQLLYTQRDEVALSQLSQVLKNG